MKPRILISRSPESRGLYEQAVEKAGGEVLSLYCPDPDLAFDALILGGGGDVDPAEFMEPNLGSREIDVPRDKAELALVSSCAEVLETICADSGLFSKITSPSRLTTFV